MAPYNPQPPFPEQPPHGQAYPGQPGEPPPYPGHGHPDPAYPGPGGHPAPGYPGPAAPGPYGPYAGGPGAGYGAHPAPAHRGKRLAARLIDIVIWSVVATALIVPLMVYVTDKDPEGETGWVGVGVGGVFLIMFGGFFLYEGIQLAKWGKTIGKKAAGLRVVSSIPPGAPLSTGRAFGRAACYPAGFTLIGLIPLIGIFNLVNVLWQFWDAPLRQCLHDKAAGTMVIDDRAR